MRSVEPACPGRHRSAPGLGTWRRSARSASPDHTARCCHRGCRSPGRRRGDVGRAGQFDHGITAALRSRALRPRRDSSAPGSLRSVRPGRDPSIGGVQPSCQRSAPGIRVDSPCSAETEPGWVSRFTSLHPLRPAVRAPLRRSLPEGRPPDEPLALLVPPRCPALQRQPPRRPHAARPAHRVNGEHELADEEHLPTTKSARERSRSSRCRKKPPCLFAGRPEPLG